MVLSVSAISAREQKSRRSDPLRGRKGHSLYRQIKENTIWEFQLNQKKTSNKRVRFRKGELLEILHTVDIVGWRTKRSILKKSNDGRQSRNPSESARSDSGMSAILAA